LQVINTILSTAQSDTKIKTFTNENGRAFDDLESATNFNNYFTNIGADLASKISNTTSSIEQFMPASRVSSAAFLPTDRCKIVSIINSLKPSNSVGLGGIVTKVVQASCHIIATPLVCLINN